MENDITVNKGELLDRLRANLRDHEVKVEQAQAGYRRKAIEELEERLLAAKNGKPLDLSIFGRMPVPRSYAAEYEQAIEELRWHTGDEIELSSRDFARYVMDRWEWAGQFTGSVQAYLAE